MQCQTQINVQFSPDAQSFTTIQTRQFNALQTIQYKILQLKKIRYKAKTIQCSNYTMQWYTNYIKQYFQAGLQSGLRDYWGKFFLQIRRLSIFSCQPSVHQFFPGRLHSHTCVGGGRSWLRGIVILLRCLLQPFCAIEKYAIVQNEIAQCVIVQYVIVQCSIVQSAIVQCVNVQCVFVRCAMCDCGVCTV